jgi:rod shape-determining protein MreC
MVSFRRRLLDYSLAGLLCVVPVLMLRASLQDPASLGGFDHAVLRISSPLQSAMSWVVEGIGGWFDDYLWLVDVEDENDELRADNDRLHQDIAALRRQVDESAVLEALVALRKRTVAETVGARIVSSSMNPYFRVVRMQLDRGDGEVAVGMPVINAENALVGRIGSTYGGYADVLLTVDPQSSVDVVIERTGGRGVVTGLATEGAYRCKIRWLERDKEVKVGDTIVTSGLRDLFPAGLKVGTIVSISTKEYEFFQEVEVEPAVDFGALRHVLVVVSAAPTPDPAPERKAAELASRLRPF